MDKRKGVYLTSAMAYPQRYVYQGQINKKCGTKFNILVTYYSQPMSVTYGGSAKEASLLLLKSRLTTISLLSHEVDVIVITT